MRFVRFHVKNFGPHRDRDLELDPKIVLIFGRNESGKSSFREAIETVLYGFDPATRDKHPIAQWSEGEGGDLHLEADYVLDDESLHRVERVLQASGKSRTAAVGAAFDGPRKGNNPLPASEGLPRALYRSVHSIELDQLCALEASTQSHVDDLLLPESQSLGLRPIAEIRNGLSADLAAIWRPRRQGNFRIRELDEALSAAHKRVRLAEDEEAALRDALREQGELEDRVAADRRTKEHLDQIDRDAPYLGALSELRRRKRALGDPIDLSGLGDAFALVDPEGVERQIRELEEDLTAPHARLECSVLEIDEMDQRVLDTAAEIRAAEIAIRTHSENRRTAAECTDEAQRQRENAVHEFEGVLCEPAEPPLLAELERLPIAQLESALERWSLDWEAHAVVPPPVAPQPPVWTLLLATFGAGSATAALLPSLPAWAPAIPTWLLPAGVALTLLGAIGAFFLRARPEPKGDPPERPSVVDALVAAFPVASVMLESPSGLRRFVESASRARQRLVDAETEEGKARRLELAIEAELETWRAICARLSIAADADGPVLIERMRSALEHATKEQQRVQDDATERQTAQTLIDAKQPLIDRHRLYLAALGKTIRANAGDTSDLRTGYEEITRRRDEQAYLLKRSAELEQDTRWVAFQDDPRVEAEFEPEDAPWKEHVTSERRTALAELDESIETAIKRLAELGDLLGRDPGSRSARARDAVANLQQELAYAKVERDRLALLDSVLARAEQRFREEHQPDVLRRASRYLERVTCGRYSRLDYLEGDDAGLFVTCRERSEPVKVDEPISRGTLDQIFLCLRLGLLDHLDADRERLPLILDDALLRMDDMRRQEIYALLRDAAAMRQVFFLTCHRAIADEAEKALATARIELSD